MKKKSTENDVDFLGGQGSLTKEEELALSEYFRSKKVKRVNNNRIKTFSRKKIAA